MQRLRAKLSVVPRNRGAKLCLILRQEQTNGWNHHLQVATTSLIQTHIHFWTCTEAVYPRPAGNVLSTKSQGLSLVEVVADVIINVYWKHFSLCLPPPWRAFAYRTNFATRQHPMPSAGCLHLQKGWKQG